MDPKSKYTLPVFMRSYLRKPIGFLVSGEELERYCREFEVIISVGDFVSASMIKDNIFPQLMIIDNKTRRGPLSVEQKELLNQSDYQVEIVSNPAGSITEDLMELVERICTNLTPMDHLKIIVDGEEDLAALPAILYAPSNATIIYGMPDKGVVIVPSTEGYKEKVRLILSKM
jgi:uncharacterized protein (UPF0218 family)